MKNQEEVERSIPSWLREVFLGFGNPGAANYKSAAMRKWGDKTAGVTKWDQPLDFADAFLKDEHLKAAFPGFTVSVEDKRKRELSTC